MLSAQQTPADPLRKDSMLQPETSIPSVPTTLDPSKPPNRQHAPLGNGRDGLRAISGPRTTPSSRMTVRLLERKCLAHIDAINNRDFYEDGVVWTDKASFWEAEIGFLSDNRMSLEQYVEAWQVLARRYPDYAIRCMSMDTVVEEKKGKAEVFANVEVEGMPVGVIRKNVGVASFEMVQGKWLATRFKTLPG